MKNDDYRPDADIRINNHRCAGMILKGSQLLLMFRRKNGKEYYVIPGGHLQQGEKYEECAIREIEEETTIKVKNLKLTFEFIEYKSNFEGMGFDIKIFEDYFDHYFIGEWESGVPTLASEEKERCTEDNYFEPMWVELKKVEHLNILPKFAKEWILERLVKRN